ncbi:uncharacterized protein BBA_08474 [Beauveria bassiana ARSEF 2860]|uniref:Uncharacterized protein n=1 Tax=Beauveria bassiana (strain ARSEF 2860) TaxID=655819 RepID=J5J850_BEAB2|nr:uncharacterized protein BBA_08474 [Beauveria bassiana ARSEF 2860]EJP62563.1 hypothetical protein BBA_08474 [Beauveria bassiana ARSEF 2860]
MAKKALIGTYGAYTYRVAVHGCGGEGHGRVGMLGAAVNTQLKVVGILRVPSQNYQQQRVSGKRNAGLAGCYRQLSQEGLDSEYKFQIVITVTVSHQTGHLVDYLAPGIKDIINILKDQSAYQ